MTLTHPAIASMRDERDTPVPMVEVEALGITVVEDGDQMDGQHVSSVPYACWCPDRRCRDDRDRMPLSNYHGYLPAGAHLITVHTYIVISETHMTTQTPTASSATASAVETTSETVVTDRWTTCSCGDAMHYDPDALKRSHAEISVAQVIARHTGRHVVPVSEIRTEAAA